MTKRVWIRGGDADDYHPFDYLDDAAEYLATQLCCGTDIQQCNEYGISDGGYFTGLNYISIFWGDDDAQPIEPVDILKLKMLIAQHTRRLS